MKKPNLVARSKTCLSNVLSHATELEIKRGEGSYLIDYNDQRYLDFGAGIAVNATGHCHPDVVSAIQEQATQLLHACAGVVYYDQNITLAEHLVSASGLDAVFFTQSGAEAVEAALKCAVYVKKSNKSLPLMVVFMAEHWGHYLLQLQIKSILKVTL